MKLTVKYVIEHEQELWNSIRGTMQHLPAHVVLKTCTSCLTEDLSVSAARVFFQTHQTLS